MNKVEKKRFYHPQKPTCLKKNLDLLVVSSFFKNTKPKFGIFQITNKISILSSQLKF